MKRLLIICLLCAGCTGLQPIVTEDKGVVTGVTDHQVEVMYEIVSDGPGKKVLNTYYKPCGHLYKRGDRYPEFSKEIDC